MNFKTKSFIGYKINQSSLFEKIEIRGCSHDLPKRRYCGVCGAKAWAIATKPIKGFFPDKGKLFEIDCFVSDEVYLYHKSFLACGDTLSSSHMKVILPNEIEQFRNKLKTALSSRNLWNENNFGIFCLIENIY